jgi:hypothetical protein
MYSTRGPATRIWEGCPFPPAYSTEEARGEVENTGFPYSRELASKPDTKYCFKELRNMWKAARNVVGTVGLIFAGYVVVTSLRDSWRYLKISSM